MQQNCFKIKYPDEKIKFGRKGKLKKKLVIYSKGFVDISWKGPPLSNVYKLCALAVLIDYMNDVASTKMIEFPTENEKLYEFKMERKYYEIIAKFNSVPISKMDMEFQEK